MPDSLHNFYIISVVLQNFYRVSTKYLQPGVRREGFRNLVMFLMFGSLSVGKVLFYSAQDTNRTDSQWQLPGKKRVPTQDKSDFAVLQTQVPKLCTGLDLSPVYILILGT